MTIRPTELQGAAVPGGYHLAVVETPRPFAEQRWFELTLEDAHGRQAREPLFVGLFSAGRPADHIAGWVDGTLYDRISWAPQEEHVTVAEEVLHRVSALLGRLVPPGGRLWLAYETFERPGPLHTRTERELTQGVPPAITPVGVLLVAAGCWAGIRDWYIPEGGMEGPRKLQGNKPLNTAHAETRRRQLLKDVETFLQRGLPDGDVRRRAELCRRLLTGTAPRTS
ncbi:MAG: DUF1122 family protein [Ardenticatenia bacterium]|nr:DUF1122 family protein [Ardenticatenia bacterium]